ncbi:MULTISPECIES: aminotransferase class I/II-fold pyridoxal phosphate-dependent enzyme [Jeotgalicoccus]|uniref:aminotransferase class I/II-fold pyridoxal phosphate-dependent enzyme n=1 Tax=Jeotgalicoccus TaxID=227979 RepID=UPI00040ED3DA|nr:MULTISPECIES: aminotransferase class I/II-fold pyridoxal phosphate-dependent enzyme [Jeotgalicoccus]QQD84807.1 aminotransferase class I/II-fold pyridoxal phosphate-dependent enzyme [Jeotgalicoccus sp. ATCC 8456]
MPTINPRATALSTPGIRVFSNQVQQMDDGINLTIGQPDFPTPDSVKAAAIQAINDNHTGYSLNAGMVELRQAVAEFFENKYQAPYSVDEVVITSGASEALDSTLRTLLVEGDEVIITAPAYPAYESLIELNGGVVKYLDVSDSDFIPSIDKLEALMTDRTKAILLNYPSNPTGASLGEKEIQAIVDFIEQKDVFLISDEIYSENVYEGQHISFGSFSSIRDKTIIIHGVSKSHSMTGWRIGYTLSPKYLSDEILKVHLSNSICATVPSQYAAIEALTGAIDYPKVMNEAYLKRRDYICERLKAMGCVVKTPGGAFYIFPCIAHTGIDDWEFAVKLLEKEHMAVVPGSAFSKYGKGHIRISFASSMEVLEEGMDRLERFMNGL